jgi:hypothetical protein
VYFHSLANIPGPRLAAVSEARYLVNGLLLYIGVFQNSSGSIAQVCPSGHWCVLQRGYECYGSASALALISSPLLQQALQRPYDNILSGDALVWELCLTLSGG